MYIPSKKFISVHHIRLYCLSNFVPIEGRLELPHSSISFCVSGENGEARNEICYWTWLLGQPQTTTFSAIRLPIKKAVLSRMMCHDTTEKKTLAEGCKVTCDQVIWNRARIPSRRVDDCVKTLRDLDETYTSPIFTRSSSQMFSRLSNWRTRERSFHEIPEELVQQQSRGLCGSWLRALWGDPEQATSRYDRIRVWSSPAQHSREHNAELLQYVFLGGEFLEKAAANDLSSWK